MMRDLTHSGRVRKVIRAFETPVFTTRDVLNAAPEANRALVDQVISRMVRAGELQRIGRGHFSRPRIHRELGPLPPPSEEIAASVERSIGMSVIPSGALALNALGLSQQVPAKLEFKTVGPSRIIQLGKREIHLRHASPRRFRAHSRIVGLVIEALYAFGRENITPETIVSVRTVLSESDRSVLRKHLGDAPIWMQGHLRQITAE